MKSNYEIQRIWEMAMCASIVSSSTLHDRFGAVQVAEKAAKIADAAVDEFQKRVDKGLFGKEG